MLTQRPCMGDWSLKLTKLPLSKTRDVQQFIQRYVFLQQHVEGTGHSHTKIQRTEFIVLCVQTQNQGTFT